MSILSRAIKMKGMVVSSRVFAVIALLLSTFAFIIQPAAAVTVEVYQQRFPEPTGFLFNTGTQIEQFWWSLNFATTPVLMTHAVYLPNGSIIGGTDTWNITGRSSPIYNPEDSNAVSHPGYGLSSGADGAHQGDPGQPTFSHNWTVPAGSAPGTYTSRVRYYSAEVLNGQPPNDANWEAEAAVTFFVRQPLTIFKYRDLNGDGNFDAGEPGLDGWHFSVTGPSGFTFSGDTSAGGFLDLPELMNLGNFTITETLTSGWRNTDPGGSAPYQKIVNLPGGIPDPTNPVVRFGNDQAPGPGQVAFFTSGTDITSDPNLYWDNANKRLGIGTATPSRPLDLKGNVALFERNVNSAGFIIERNGADVSGYNRWVFGVDEPTGFVIKTYPYDGATAVNQLVITKDNPSTPANESKVGIGTMSPSGRLDVDETNSNGTAVEGRNTAMGNRGALGLNSYGVVGHSSNGTGVYGQTSSEGAGVSGYSPSGTGVSGFGPSVTGVYGESDSGTGVNGVSNSGTGVRGYGGNYDFYAGGPGANYAPFTGSHEVKLAAGFTNNIKPGLIVSATGETQVRNEKGQLTYSSTLPTVQLAATANDKKVFGVLIGESPLPKDHWYQAKEGERFGIVNALGEGRVWVTNFNGNIEAGDYVTTSNIAGYGQKQADDLLHSYTLGKATENVDWSKVSETVELDGKTYKAYPIAVVYTSG